MRLLIISLNGDPLADLGSLHAGGQCKYILELGKNLVGLGWDIDVLTIRNSNSPQSDRITEGFSVIRIPRRGNVDYDYDICIEEVNEMAKHLRRNRAFDIGLYNVALCCYWLSGVFLETLDPARTCPRAITLCSLGIFKRAFAGKDRRLDERIEKEIELVGSFDKIIATNKAELSALQDNYKAAPGNIHLIPRGIDPKVFNEYT